MSETDRDTLRIWLRVAREWLRATENAIDREAEMRATWRWDYPLMEVLELNKTWRCNAVRLLKSIITNLETRLGEEARDA